jgi:hypothetical protein
MASISFYWRALIFSRAAISLSIMEDFGAAFLLGLASEKPLLPIERLRLDLPDLAD